MFDTEGLLARLESLGEAKYAAFNASLVPELEGRAYGVRVPLLRGIGREIIRSVDWRDFLDASRTHDLFEMRMLHGIVLAGARCPIGEKLALTDAFLPHVDNWAVCDTFVSSFKPKPAELPPTYAFAVDCAESGEEFRKRFGLVLLMARFKLPEYLPGVMAVYRGFQHEGYYARMGAAWGLATLWPSAREACLGILEENLWDPFTHNKAIQKLRESYRISEADKALARTLIRRET